MSFLSDVKENDSAIIVGFDNNLPIEYKRRLCNLGFVVDTKVNVAKISIKKRTMLLELRGYTLTIETNICSKIKVRI